MIRQLLFIHWKQFRRSLSLRTVLPVLALGFAALLILPLLIRFSAFIGSQMSVEQWPGLIFLLSTLTAIVILLFSIPDVFKQLFSARDVEQLFPLPIQTRHIFWLKFVQSFLSVPLLMMIVLSIFLLVMGIVSQASLLFYPSLVIVTLSISLIGMSVAYLFNLLLVQIIPASRAKEFMVIMSAVAMIVVLLLFQFPHWYGDQTFLQQPDSSMALLPEAPVWFPLAWGALALTAALQGELTAFVSLGGLVLFTVGLVWGTTLLVERGFRTGWIRLSESRKSVRKKGKQSLRLSSPIVVIGLKEWKMIQRDAREWMAFLPVVIVLVLLLFQFVTSGEGLMAMLSEPLLSWVIIQLMLIFIFALTVGSFAASSIGREGEQHWILRTLPVRGEQIAWGKLWIHWLIPLVMIVCIEVVLGLVFSWQWLWVASGVLTYAFLSLGMTAIGLFMGTLGAKYHPENPQQRLAMGTSMLLFVFNVLYLVLMAIPALLLLIPVEYASFFIELAETAGVLIGTFSYTLGNLLLWKGQNELLFLVSGGSLIVVLGLLLTYVFVKLSAIRINAGVDIEMEDTGREGAL